MAPITADELEKTLDPPELPPHPLQAAVDYFDKIYIRFRNHKDDMETIQGIFLAYFKHKHLTEQQIYVLVYAFFYATDSQDLLPGFLDFMPNYKDADLDWLNEKIRRSKIDEEEWEDLCARIGLKPRAFVRNNTVKPLAPSEAEDILAALDRRFPARPSSPVQPGSPITLDHQEVQDILAALERKFPAKDETLRGPGRQPRGGGGGAAAAEDDLEIQGIIYALGRLSANKLQISIPPNGSENWVDTPNYSPITPSRSPMISPIEPLASSRGLAQAAASALNLMSDASGWVMGPSISYWRHRTSTVDFDRRDISDFAEAANNPYAPMPTSHEVDLPDHSPSSMQMRPSNSMHNASHDSASLPTGTSEQASQNPRKPSKSNLSIIHKHKAVLSPKKLRSSIHKNMRSVTFANAQPTRTTIQQPVSSSKVTSTANSNNTNNNTAFVSKIYPTRRSILSRAGLRPYIHAVCGASFVHPDDVAAHARGKTGRADPGCKGLDDQGQEIAWDAHPSCQVKIKMVKYAAVKGGFAVSDRESMEKIDAAIEAGMRDKAERGQG